MTKRPSRLKIPGTIWNRKLAKAYQGNADARQALADIHHHLTTAPSVSKILLSQLTAQAAIALAQNQEAIRELQEIAESQSGKEEEK